MPSPPQAAADARLQAHDPDAYRRKVFVNRPGVRAVRAYRAGMLDGNPVKAGEVVLILPSVPPPGTASVAQAAQALEDGWVEPLTEEHLAALTAAEQESEVKP